jgi:hypothetical protein
MNSTYSLSRRITVSTARLISLVGLLVFGFLPMAQATLLLNENFNSGVLDPRLSVYTSPGFSFTESGGVGNVTKAAGIGNGIAYVGTNFQVFGDFTASVEVKRTGLSTIGEMGLTTPNTTDVFFVDNNQINSNIFVSPGFGTRSVQNSSSSVLFQIRRLGNTIFQEYNDGTGFKLLHSASAGNSLGPTYLGFFLLQEYGDTGAHSGSFDNFRISDSGAAVPLPATIFLLGSGLVGVAAFRRRVKKWG